MIALKINSNKCCHRDCYHLSNTCHHGHKSSPFVFFLLLVGLTLGGYPSPNLQAGVDKFETNYDCLVAGWPGFLNRSNTSQCISISIPQVESTQCADATKPVACNPALYGPSVCIPLGDNGDSFQHPPHHYIGNVNSNELCSDEFIVVSLTRSVTPYGGLSTFLKDAHDNNRHSLAFKQDRDFIATKLTGTERSPSGIPYQISDIMIKDPVFTDFSFLNMFSALYEMHQLWCGGLGFGPDGIPEQTAAMNKYFGIEDGQGSAQTSPLCQQLDQHLKSANDQLNAPEAPGGGAAPQAASLPPGAGLAQLQGLEGQLQDRDEATRKIFPYLDALDSKACGLYGSSYGGPAHRLEQIKSILQDIRQLAHARKGQGTAAGAAPGGPAAAAPGAAPKGPRVELTCTSTTATARKSIKLQEGQAWGRLPSSVSSLGNEEDDPIRKFLQEKAAEDSSFKSSSIYRKTSRIQFIISRNKDGELVLNDSSLNGTRVLTFTDPSSPPRAGTSSRSQLIKKSKTVIKPGMGFAFMGEEFICR